MFWMCVHSAVDVFFPPRASAIYFSNINNNNYFFPPGKIKKKKKKKLISSIKFICHFPVKWFHMKSKVVMDVTTTCD